MRLASLLALICPALALSGAAWANDAAPQPRGAGIVATGSLGDAGQVGPLSVTIDRAKVIRLPEGVRTVIVGNPSIADVAIQKSGVVVITGKSYGVTNLIALDGTGNMLAESTLNVRGPTDAVVVLQRGPSDRQSYSCTPNCQPSLLLGDGTAYFSDNKTQIDQRISAATQK